MALPLVPLALGAVAIWALTHQQKAPAFSASVAKSGRKWLTRTLVGAGPPGTSTVEVWAPAGAFGPHLDVLVATYRQTGSDMTSRVALSTGPSAQPAMITAAGIDFGIKKPA